MEKDYSKAFELFSQAAKNNFPPAQDSLGMLYVRGEGCSRDYAKAAELFTTAWERAHLPDAAYNLAMLHEFGQGVKQSHTKAVNYCREAANRGHVAATEWLIGNGYTPR